MTYEEYIQNRDRYTWREVMDQIDINNLEGLKELREINRSEKYKKYIEPIEIKVSDAE